MDQNRDEVTRCQSKLLFIRDVESEKNNGSRLKTRRSRLEVNWSRFGADWVDSCLRGVDSRGWGSTLSKSPENKVLRLCGRGRLMRLGSTHASVKFLVKEDFDSFSHLDPMTVAKSVCDAFAS